jgi:hypothetical protein
MFRRRHASRHLEKASFESTQTFSDSVRLAFDATTSARFAFLYRSPYLVEKNGRGREPPRLRLLYCIIAALLLLPTWLNEATLLGPTA